MLEALTENAMTAEQLAELFQVGPREIRYRLQALIYFDLVIESGSTTRKKFKTKLQDEASGLRTLRPKCLLARKIKEWEPAKILDPRIGQPPEWKIWEVLQAENTVPLKESTLSRRVSSLKSLARWAYRMDC
jgi:hypothetical protein